MEHRLITGGSEYLPFARNCVQKLKKTGLRYASQTYVIDGVNINVRIADGQEFIRIEGGETTVYMESGKLLWTFPHPESQYRYDPANWDFLDINTDASYLGYIKFAASSVPSSGRDGDQKNKPPLANQQESKAIGFDRVVLGESPTQAQIDAAAIKDAETKQAAGEDTVMKKLVAGFFPASLFTGKMRLFMQATYGAKTAIGKYPLSLELMGSSVLLWYNSNGLKLQFGFWSHKTPGIYTAPDGTFWLLDITIPYGDVVVTSYPITPGANVKGLVKRYKEGKFTGDEKTKVEAYIFANSVIDVSKPVVVGSHTTAAASGGAMAYGWKFNTGGDTAKIVVSTGSGAGITARWTSYTVTLNFTYADGAIGMTGSTALNGDWMDGWGTFNMFVPDSETTSAPLAHFSITSGFPRPDFDFPITEIYGYFKDNVWVPVKVSRTKLVGPFPKDTQSSSGILFDNPAYADATNHYQYGYTPADQGYTYESHSIWSGTGMDLVVGGNTYTGKSNVGFHRFVTREVMPGGTFPNAVDFTASQVGTGSFFSQMPPGYASGGPGGFVKAAAVDYWDISYYGSYFEAWALIIPCLDCEAAFVATHVVFAPDSSGATKVHITDGRGITRFFGDGYDYVPWASTDSQGNGWYGQYGPDAVTTSLADQPEWSDTTKIICYTTALDAVQGAPAHSYSSIFTVDYTYPFYDPGMYSITSYGKRYDISEGLMSRPSVGTQPRFVGWA